MHQNNYNFIKIKNIKIDACVMLLKTFVFIKKSRIRKND